MKPLGNRPWTFLRDAESGHAKVMLWTEGSKLFRRLSALDLAQGLRRFQLAAGFPRENILDASERDMLQSSIFQDRLSPRG